MEPFVQKEAAAPCKKSLCAIIKYVRLFFITNRNWWMPIFIVFAISLLITFLSSVGISFGTANTMVTCTVIIFISKFFHYEKSGQALQMYTLPISALEKFIGALVSAYAIYGVTMVSVLAGAAVGNLLKKFIFDAYQVTWFLDDMPSSVELLLSAAWISIFLFGSVYFKRSPVWKTLGIVLLYSYIISTFAFVLFAFLRPQPEAGAFLQGFSIAFTSETLHFNLYFYATIIFIVLIFHVLTFLRIRETEV